MPNSYRYHDATHTPESLEEALIALNDLETRMRGLFESDLIGIGFSDAAGHILDVNPAFLRMVGYTLEDFTSGRVNWREMTPPEYLPLDQKAIEELRRTGIAEPIAKEFIRKDGSRVPVLLAGRLLDGSMGTFACVAIDLTESHAAAHALQETQRQYFTLIDSLPQLVWTTRPDGVPDYMSQQWHDYTGCGLEETMARGWGFFLPPEDQAPAASAWQKAVETGEPYAVEYRLRGKEGQFRWFLARGVPLKDAHGKITRWLGTCTDIEDQKREEVKQRLLARLSEQTRTVAAPEEATWTAIRLLGEHLHASRSTYNAVDEENDRVTAHRDYCTEGESILGTFPLSSFGPALVEDLRAGRTAIIQDTSTDPRTAPAFETVYRQIGVRSFIAAPLLKEGRLVTILSVNMLSVRAWTEEEARLVEEVAERTWLAVENARLFQAAQREVEERKRAEEHSRGLAAIVEFSQDAIVSKDLDGIITSWNAAAERIYGYSAAEILGKSKALLMPAHLPDELVNILDRIRRGERIGHYDTVRRRKDGSLVEVSVSVSPIIDAEGRIVGASTIARDITERKQAEAERARHLAEIELLNEQLERAMTETHHRVRNNLQMIAALVEIEAPEAGATVAAEEFQRIGGHVRALAAVHELLTERAKKDSSATDISSREVLLRLVDLVRQTAGELHVVTDIEDTLLSAQQGTSLTVVAHELITNALKYGRGIIGVRFLVREGLATLEITDNGPGFQESFRPEANGNTGLELVSQLVRWDLRAEKMEFGTSQGGGGRVTIRIPLAPRSS